MCESVFVFPFVIISVFSTFFFFFYFCVDHRGLHSFPTRRSSDLWPLRLVGMLLGLLLLLGGCSMVRRSSYEPPPLIKDRKSTRLNSSHGSISYAVFCLKKKKKIQLTPHDTQHPPPNRRIERRSLH